MKLKREHASLVGRSFYTNHCSARNYPLNLLQLLDDLNISIIYDRCKDGYTLYNSIKGNYLIVVDSNSNAQRLRFTIAHELGHIILNHFIDYNVSTLSENEQRILDLEADIFAGEILMPFTQIINYNLPSDKLSQIFDVSRSAMMTRLHFIDYKRITKTIKRIELRCSELDSNNEMALDKLHEQWLYNF